MSVTYWLLWSASTAVHAGLVFMLAWGSKRRRLKLERELRFALEDLAFQQVKTLHHRRLESMWRTSSIKMLREVDPEMAEALQRRIAAVEACYELASVATATRREQERERS